VTIAEVNGRKIPFEDTGGDGVPLVLAHGFFMDRSMFEPQVTALRERWRVITYDERGHGEAADEPDPHSYWDLAEDLTGLLDHLGVQQAVVGGMSQGGFIALRLALRHPERVVGLVLLDSQAGVELAEKLVEYEAMRSVWEEDGPSELMGGMVAAIILGAYAGNPDWVARWIVRYPKGLGQIYRTLMDRDDITDRLGEIKAPALVVHGDEDAAIPMERAEILCAGLSGCEGVAVIAGGSHSANLNRPEAVNAAIAGFLDRLGERR
jgi:pimeloyl-ACP methyl ester carboxylesterase